MFVVTVIVGIFISIALSIGANFFFAGKVRANAERYATNYAREIEHYTAPRVQCMSLDTDNNGYVTCMISDAATSSRPTQIECAANMFMEVNVGCRGYRVRTLDINSDQQ